MRPLKKEWALTALSANGFAAALTGVGPFTTFNKPADGISHQTTLQSAANLSTITMTIVGTDANGNTQTEAIAGPNANTINLTKYYKTITSITASATLGANTMNVGWTALCQTPVIPVDFAKLTGPMVSVGLDGTTVNYTMQQTNVDIFAEPQTDDWFTLGTASSTTNTAAQALAGATAIRVQVASHTTGTLELAISQARQ